MHAESLIALSDAHAFVDENESKPERNYFLVPTSVDLTDSPSAGDAFAAVGGVKRGVASSGQSALNVGLAAFGSKRLHVAALANARAGPGPGNPGDGSNGK